ncbi:peptidoglycan editing factor PgeF [Anaerolineae bacterium CFX9]|nr:peptidoglycan editing factor PgeF [Anaerolineae bacterium CFX9]
MIQQQVNGLVFYQFEMWQDAPLRHGIFTRRGGVSEPPFDTLNLGGNVGDQPGAVRENHLRMYGALGVEDARACSVWQVHSADVVLAEAPASDRRWLTYADAMITDRPETPLSMRFADCVPILFYDPVRAAIGMAHAGWRGTVLGVAANTVQAMVDAFGCQPRDIQAAIGPSIGPDNYQVGEEVVAAVIDYFGSADGLIRRSSQDGSAWLNLWEANRRALERAGVTQVEVAGICTAEHVDEWFSHRREQGRTGRFGAVLSL